MIYDIEPGTFGGPSRNGDMIAIINAIQYRRLEEPDTKFHMKPGTIIDTDYCRSFFNYLVETTDFFSLESSGQSLPWRKVNLWDLRDLIGDHVSIKNTKEKEDKIVFFPLYDAPYNYYRNWPIEVYNQLLDSYSTNKIYDNCEKIVCCKDDVCVPKGWKLSRDFMTNIHHIETAKVFIGGDTGTSHYAWALDNGPESLNYVNSSRALVHTLPFHLLNGKGQYIKYWLDFEGTTWKEHSNTEAN